MTVQIEIANGCRYLPQYLDICSQKALLAHLRQALSAAPLFQPVMPRSGKAFSVRMSNMGELGWVSDREKGYRYQDRHPVTGEKWPAMPDLLPRLWRKLTGCPLLPEACLINYYDASARMGQHRDDENHLAAPIMSISLGDQAKFRLGGLTRSDASRTFMLSSGDILILEPPLRDAYHGIDRILGGSSRLLEEGGRFNLTMRRVHPAHEKKQWVAATGGNLLPPSADGKGRS